MRSLTLQHVPFKWSAPIFQNLQTLSLRTLHTTRIALDRVLYVITASPGLLDLSLHVATVDQAVLPLTLTTLPDLKNLSISGHYLLTNLVDSLALPCLETLSFDVDARDPAEDTILSLVSRSNNPPLTNLNISYGGPATSNTGIYYGTGTLIANWNFLSDLDHLKTLHVGGTPFEPLVTMLAAPDDDGQQDRWLCPNLVSLRMRGCHAHHDAAAKLVQMVESRNPDIMAGATPIQVAGSHQQS